MAGELSATTDQISWVLTSYIVAASIVMPMTGFLADRMGRRKYLLLSILGFVIASALCGIAGSLPEMVAFRLLQGLFGASLVPLSQAIMVDIYPPEDRGKALAIWGMGVMVAPILGPTIGGWLTETVNWRWNFYINVPIGALSLLLAWRYVPDTPVKERDMDWWGFVFLAAFIAGLQYTLDRVGFGMPSWVMVSPSACPSACWWPDSRCSSGTPRPRAAIRSSACGCSPIATSQRRRSSVPRWPVALRRMLLQPLFFEGILQFHFRYRTRDGAARRRQSCQHAAGGPPPPEIRREEAHLFRDRRKSCGRVDAHRLASMPPGGALVPLLLQGFGVGFVFIPLSAVAFATLPKGSPPRRLASTT
jgi:DHA2 family multidrug resistance protein